MEKITVIAEKNVSFLKAIQLKRNFQLEVLQPEGYIEKASSDSTLVFYYGIDSSILHAMENHVHQYYILPEGTILSPSILRAYPLWFEMGIKAVYLESDINEALIAELLSKARESTHSRVAVKPIQDEHALVLDSMGDGLIVLDQHLKIARFNKAAKWLTGYEANRDGQDFLPVFQLKNEGLRIDVRALLEKAKQSDTSVGLNTGTLLETLDGLERYISASIAPVFDGEQRDFKGYIIVFRDITRIVNAEKRIQLFSNIIRTSSNYIVITDSQMAIIYANDCFEKKFRKKGQVLFGTKLSALEGLERIDFNRVISYVQSQSSFNQELQLTMDGENRLFLMQVAHHETRMESVVYYFTFIDVHEQRQAESTLASERRLFLDVFEHSPIGIVILDRHHQVVQVNTAFSEMFHISKHSAIGSTFGSVISCSLGSGNQVCGTGDDCIQCPINKAIQEITDHSIKRLGSEFTLKRVLQGHVADLIVRMSGVPVNQRGEMRALLLFEDITQHRAVERTLLDNERQLRIITDNMQEAITYLSQEGLIVYASPSYERFLGYKPEDLIGKSFSDYLNVEFHPEGMDALFKKLSRRSTYSTELSLKRKDGTALWVETTGNLYKHNDGTESLILVSRDISMKHKTLEEMERVKEMAVAANRAKSEFLANMSHEIRTPMNGIIGMTNLTLLTELDENQRENLQMVRSSAESLLKIINSILDFSKIEAGKFSIENVEFQLDTLLNRMRQAFHMQAVQKNIEFRITCTTDLKQMLIGDMNRLTQILNNLLGNALKFTDAGYIELIITEINQTYNDIDLLFEVVDTGIGIEHQYQHRLFDSFSQADGSITRRFGGTGLGLSITKQLVELMGGTIDFESTALKGSRFFFNLKLKRVTKVEPKMVVASRTIPDPAYAAKVLLAEDDRINQILAKRLLDKQGHEVTIAENGEIAVQLASKMAFDLILMDIQMPIMDGIEATKRIRTMKGYKEVPIVALTAYAIKGDRDKFLSMGMDEYISKPIDLERFYRVINDLLVKGKAVSPIEEVDSTPVEKQVSDEEWLAFHQTFKESYQLLETYISGSDFEKAEKQAHFLKVISQSVYEESLKKCAFKLELALRKENASEALKGLAALNEAYENFSSKGL